MGRERDGKDGRVATQRTTTATITTSASHMANSKVHLEVAAHQVPQNVANVATSHAKVPRVVDGPARVVDTTVTSESASRVLRLPTRHINTQQTRM
jgi:hypothetical protein